MLTHPPFAGSDRPKISFPVLQEQEALGRLPLLKLVDAEVLERQNATQLLEGLLVGVVEAVVDPIFHVDLGDSTRGAFKKKKVFTEYLRVCWPRNVLASEL